MKNIRIYSFIAVMFLFAGAFALIGAPRNMATGAVPTPTPFVLEQAKPEAAPDITLTLFAGAGASLETLKPTAVSPAPGAPCVAFLLPDGSKGIFCGTYKLIIK